MIVESQKQLGTFLDYVAKELDVPEELQQQARAKYDALGSWLKKDSLDRFQADSELYSQGSIRLGTMVQPVKEDDDYDIDLVYRRNLAKSSVTQAELKAQIGEQLEDYLKSLAENGEEVPELEEKRRCWKLTYQGGFHMDVLPSIPDEDAYFNNTRDHADGILITDKELWCWHPSNPRGYANWFDDQNIALLMEERKSMAEAASVDVEDIPVGIVKTPLRRAVQLFKRHRDHRYRGNPDDKPISIIITTLAARAYQGETEPYTVLTLLAARMPDLIEKRNGVYWVPNPVSPQENFADKWEKYPGRADRFFEWMAQIQMDIESALEGGGIYKVADILGESFGESVTKKAALRYGDEIYGKRKSEALKMAAGTGILGSTGATVQGHTWFGSRTSDKEA